MMRRPAVVYFEIEHSGCWTATTRDYSVRIKTLKQEFTSQDTFRAWVAVSGDDIRRFIPAMRRARGILGLHVHSTSRAWMPGGASKLAFMEFESLREGSISNLVYSLGGIILDQEVVGGVERWRILIPRSSKKVEELLERKLREVGRLLKISFSRVDGWALNSDPSSVLSDSERKALYLAVSMGLIDYPRRARIADVAKMMGVSPATFIYHLRRGEKKLIGMLLGALSEGG